MTDIELILQIAPGIISLVQQLVTLFNGNKASAQVVAMAATAHPDMTAHQKTLVGSVIDNALKLAA
ncbi:MAG: hypothetical protein KGL39_11465 [Patescibacteria group bacterium]|nr:hypothetical protein [Patescibacteria group bacterium]